MFKPRFYLKIHFSNYWVLRRLILQPNWVSCMFLAISGLIKGYLIAVNFRKVAASQRRLGRAVYQNQSRSTKTSIVSRDFKYTLNLAKPNFTADSLQCVGFHSLLECIWHPVGFQVCLKPLHLSLNAVQPNLRDREVPKLTAMGVVVGYLNQRCLPQQMFVYFQALL